MHWLDILIFIVVIIALVIGFGSGLIMQLASLAGIVLGAMFAGQLSSYVAPKLVEFTSFGTHIISPLSYFVAFLLVFISLLLLGKMFTKFAKSLQLSFINRITGAVFSSAKWLLLVSIVFNLLLELDSKSNILKKDTLEQSLTYPFVKNLAPTIVPFLQFGLNNPNPKAEETTATLIS